jgi:kumamolisin
MSSNPERSTIAGSIRLPKTAARIVGSPKPAEIITATLLLRRRPDAPSSPSLPELSLPKQHRHITHEEFDARYGADPRDIERVEAVARKHRLDIIESSIAKRTVLLSGSAETMSEVFGVDFTLNENGRGVHRSYTGEISVPSELAQVVEWVFGLHVAPFVSPSLRARRIDTRSPSLEHISYKATEVATTYNFPPSLDGTGECIGIIEMSGGYRQSDLESYFRELGCSVPQIVTVGENRPGENIIEDMEVTLDISMAGAVADGARLVVYFAGGASTGDVYNIMATAIHDATNDPSVLSFSWGNPETEEWTPKELEKLNELFAEAAHLGVTICTSSGDSGSCTPNGNESFSAPPIPDFPASSPFVLSCGGTTLIARDHHVESEVVWNCLAELLEFVFDDGTGSPISLLGHGGSSGGGVSSCIDLPPYQASADVPSSVRTQWKNGMLEAPTVKRGRGVPDVAGNADLNSGYRIVFDGEWIISGGTSAVAPLWAGLIARINQDLQRRVGFLNPLLYHLRLDRNADIVRPITSGNNGGYEASPDRRWNACTGLGVPDGTKLLEALRDHHG